MTSQSNECDVRDNVRYMSMRAGEMKYYVLKFIVYGNGLYTIIPKQWHLRHH